MAPNTLDGEIAGLQKNRGHRRICRLESAQVGIAHSEGVHVHGGLFGIGHEPGRGPGLEPIRLQLHVSQCAAKGDGIEHAHHSLVKAISVVHGHKLGKRSVDIDPELIGQGSKAHGIVLANLLVRVAQQGRRRRVHREVRQVIKVREDGDLRELRDTGHKTEALHGLRLLDNRVERLEERLEWANLLRAHPMREGFVVFVNKKDNLTARRQSSNVFDKRLQTDGSVVLVAQDNTEPVSLRTHRCHDAPLDFSDGLSRAQAHIEADDRIRSRPVPRQRIYRQALKQVAPALKKLLERREQQRLAKTARTREKELVAHGGIDQRIHQSRLVDIGDARFADGLEVVCVCGNTLQLHGMSFRLAYLRGHSTTRYAAEENGPPRTTRAAPATS